MIYANPVRAEYVSGAYYDKEAAGYYLSPAKLESDYADVRFERELRLFRQHCCRGAVLDVGCSSGAFLYQLNRRFPGQYEILGIDASGPALDYAASHDVPVIRGNFLDQDFRGRRFDALTFWAVLEHLSEPKRFLEQAWSILRENGVCLVLVPNMRSLSVRVLGARYRYIYPQHLNYFAATTLRRLAQNRFTIVEVRSTHWNPLVLWQDWRSGGQEVSNQQRAALLQRTTAYKRHPLLKPAKLVYRVLERFLGTLALADNLFVVLAKTIPKDLPGG